MAVEGGFLQAGTYSAEVLRRVFGVLLERGATVGSVVGGLAGATDLQTTAGTGMNVETSVGEAIVNQAYTTSGGPNYIRNTSTLTSKVPAASPTLPRIDAIIAQVADAAYHGSSNEYAISYLEGTPTAGATLANRETHGQPAIPTSSLVLAYILIPANAVKPENVNIENVAKQLHPGLGAATYLEGTAAARPASGAKGRIYYATDTKIYSVDTGAAWHEIPSVLTEEWLTDSAIKKATITSDKLAVSGAHYGERTARTEKVKYLGNATGLVYVLAEVEAPAIAEPCFCLIKTIGGVEGVSTSFVNEAWVGSAAKLTFKTVGFWLVPGQEYEWMGTNINKVVTRYLVF